MPNHSQIWPPTGSHHKYLQENKGVRNPHAAKEDTYLKCKRSPSAPKSGLKDFFSLKFLNIFTTLLLSLIAYLKRDYIVKKEVALFLKQPITDILSYYKTSAFHLPPKKNSRVLQTQKIKAAWLCDYQTKVSVFKSVYYLHSLKTSSSKFKLTQRQKRCYTYSEESCAHTNSCAEPKLLFLRAIAV